VAWRGRGIPALARYHCALINNHDFRRRCRCCREAVARPRRAGVTRDMPGVAATLKLAADATAIWRMRVAPALMLAPYNAFSFRLIFFFKRRYAKRMALPCVVIGGVL